MINTTEDFEYGKDILLVYLKNGFNFLYKGYKVVLKKKQYNLKLDGSNLENVIRDDIYREAVRLLKTASLKDRSNRFLRFSFYNENRDPENEEDIKRFDISLDYDSAPYLNDIIIECKRLKKNEKNKAYIDNGVERFETNRYGYGLPIGGMIGFIEKGDENKIKADLSKRLTKKTTTISVSSASGIFSGIINNHIFQSDHNRPKPLGQIKLIHLMLDFTSIIDDD